MAEAGPDQTVRSYAFAQRRGARGVARGPDISRAGFKRHGLLTVAVIAALFCFVWQSIVVQAHFHTRSAPVTQVARGVTVSLATVQKGQPSPDDPANCPICQERAHTGAYLLLGAIVFDVPRTVHTWVGAMPLLASASDKRSHSWQSRAPPVYLQT